MGAAIVVLGSGALAVARRLRDGLPGSAIHGLRDRVGAEVDVSYEHLGRHLCELHAAGRPIIALCAAGIVIRALAARVAGAQKDADPPVLAVAEDGSAVVPLLGGLNGANDLARRIAAALGVAPAITTSGELRFGTCLLNPPDGYALASLDKGKRFVSDLLAGEPARISGEAPWLEQVRFPRADNAARVICITPQAGDGAADELRIHPHCVAVAIDRDREDADALECEVGAALDHCGLARRALAVLVAPRRRMRHAALREAAARLGATVRYVETEPDALPAQWLACALPAPYRLAEQSPAVAVAVSPGPLDPARIGQARGSVAVIGLGPGSRDFMVPAARAALERATDILGYTTYVEMAGPLAPHQRVHGTDNREEMQRARHAFALAAEGRDVAVVSSGDPGIFAMAAAVLEALETAADPAWHDVQLDILPGVSAAMATAAMAGAPLGHDFCLISLSDNLKPWDVIEKRLRLAAEADLVMGFYNPISKARPWQLERALELIRMHRASSTPVVLGRDVQRPGGRLVSLSLGELTAAQVDMRTTVIVGSSTTRRFPRDGASDWVYTPRWYPAPT